MSATTTRVSSARRLAPVLVPSILQPVANLSEVVTLTHVDLAREALADYWVKNNAANAAKRSADAAKKLLNERMTAAGMKTLNQDIPAGEYPVAVVAKIAAGSRKVVDVSKLHKLVNNNQFMMIIEASQTAVTDIAGTNVLNACLVTQATEEALTVKKL